MNILDMFNNCIDIVKNPYRVFLKISIIGIVLLLLSSSNIVYYVTVVPIIIL